jgi:hypothetical protein
MYWIGYQFYLYLVTGALCATKLPPDLTLHHFHWRSPMKQCISSQMNNHTELQRPKRENCESNRKSKEEDVSERHKALDGHDSSYPPFCNRTSAPRYPRFDLVQSGESYLLSRERAICSPHALFQALGSGLLCRECERFRSRTSRGIGRLSSCASQRRFRLSIRRRSGGLIRRWRRGRLLGL